MLTICACNANMLLENAVMNYQVTELYRFHTIDEITKALNDKIYIKCGEKKKIMSKQ